MDISKLTLRKAAAALRSRSISAYELSVALLEQIEARNGALNAYIWLDREAALAEARRADDLLESGHTGALLGVPLAIKDNISVAGQPCGCASKMLEGYCAPYDATVIARLRAAGALPLGRTNMDEFALGSTGESSIHGAARNPHNQAHTAGGSSGGSAAAVAGGLALGALGSDTGGSVRQPAAFCGCVGLKPSYGRISRCGAVACASSLDQIGTLTKDVGDAALLLQLMAGGDAADSISRSIAVPDYLAHCQRDINGLRLGLPREFLGSDVDGEIAGAVQKAASACEAQGARLVEVSLPHTEYVVATYCIIMMAEISTNLARYDGIRYGRRSEDAATTAEMYCKTRAQFFGAEVKRRILLGTYVLGSKEYDAYYMRALKARTLIQRDFAEAFQQCDALLAPVTATTATPLGLKGMSPLQHYLGDQFTAGVNLAALCAISIPCGFSGNGLPLVMQIIGPAFKEERILQIAAAYERAMGGAQ